MRVRYACDKCGFKSTSNEVLNVHNGLHHEKKGVQNMSKRKACDICGKRFNKEATFNHHMKKEHKEISNSNGRSK